MCLRNTPKLRDGIFIMSILLVLIPHPRAIAAETGFQESRSDVFTKCWNYSSSPDLSTAPVADSRRFYFLNSENKLEAADLHTATKLWSSELGGKVISNLLTDDNALFVVSGPASNEASDSAKGVLRSLSKETGVTNWSTLISDASRVTLGVLNGNVVSVEAGGSIEAFDPVDGRRVWNKDLAAHISADPVFVSGELILATDKKEVLAVSGKDGPPRLISRTKYLPTAILLDTPDGYLIGDERGNLTLASRNGKPIWRFRNGARISFLLSYESEFLAASFDNFIYKLSRGGNVEWKRRLSGRTANRPLISGDTAVVAIVGDDSVYFIDLKNGKISNRIEASDGDVGGLVTSVGQSALVLSGTRGLAMYSRDRCPVK